MDALRNAGLGHIAVIIGGIVPDNELGLMQDAGVAHIFHPGASRVEIVERVEELVDGVRAADLRVA